MEERSEDFINGWYGEGLRSDAPSPDGLEEELTRDGSNGVYVVDCGVHMDGCYVTVSSVDFCEDVWFSFKGPMTKARAEAIRDFFSRDLRCGA